MKSLSNWGMFHCRESAKAKAIEVTLDEGGDWIPFPCKHLNRSPGIRVHSIKFDDGSIWDAFNGWRKPRGLPPMAEQPKSWVHVDIGKPVGYDYPSYPVAHYTLAEILTPHEADLTLTIVK